jgi:hypothetical protein
MIDMGDYHLKPAKTVRARNADAYALGRQERGGFRVRRVVWGRFMARMERRDGEEIRRACILVEGVTPKRRRRIGATTWPDLPPGPA